MVTKGRVVIEKKEKGPARIVNDIVFLKETKG